MFTLEELIDLLKVLGISPDEVKPESRFFEDLNMDPLDKEELANLLAGIHDIYVDREAWDGNVFTPEDALRLINGEEDSNDRHIHVRCLRSNRDRRSQIAPQAFPSAAPAPDTSPSSPSPPHTRSPTSCWSRYIRRH